MQKLNVLSIKMSSISRVHTPVVFYQVDYKSSPPTRSDKPEKTQPNPLPIVARTSVTADISKPSSPPPTSKSLPPPPRIGSKISLEEFEEDEEAS
jgi:hypothetical protein